jgi:hypothetical protein
MDGDSFDNLARGLSVVRSRRRGLATGLFGLGTLLGGRSGPSGPMPMDASAKKGKGKRKGRKGKKKDKKKDDKPRCTEPKDQECGQTCCDSVNGPCCKGNVCCESGLSCCGGDKCCEACRRDDPKECCPQPNICGNACCDSTFACCRTAGGPDGCCPPGSKPLGLTGKCSNGNCGCCPIDWAICGDLCCPGGCCPDNPGQCYDPNPPVECYSFQHAFCATS